MERASLLADVMEWWTIHFHYITLHYITLHYITLHYITLLDFGLLVLLDNKLLTIWGGM